MAYSEDIIDAAKNFYLTINDKGGREYSYAEILQKLQEKFTKKKTVKLSKETICSWAKKGNWEADLQAVKSLGQQKAIEASRDKELALTDAKSDDIAERRIGAKRIKDKADRLLEMTLDKMIANGVNEIDLRILQQISHQREEVIRNLDGVEQPKSAVETKLDKLLSAYEAD